MKSEKTTMSDIAKALAISNISVSRALSGQDGVSEELRSKILIKASEMGYLRAKSSGDKKILVLHQKPFIQDSSNYSHMIQGIEKALQTVGCAYDVEFVDKSRQEKLYLPHKVAKGSGFDGIIFIGGFENPYVRFMASKIKNQVFYTGYSPVLDCDSVWYNFNNSGYKQCEYLIQKGHERIGFIGGSSVYANKEKVLGIELALEDHALPVRDDFFIYAEGSFEEKVSELIHDSKGKGPTALICQWDYTAIKLIKYLYEKGIRVPEDLSVIGSGNTEMASLSIPALTTLELHIDQACESAVELLFKRIEEPDKPYETVRINSTLVERDSVKAVE
ncbi:LacI family DNA-binding transcriptional regulator [Desulfosporosinus sp. PR]|uniref:LacI family DNA-binding transcriptional regulator n=1 Tax=Candidatus Desulfosporosinus nitrosoreducens TaxID=3401928 RepID=UPI0027FAB45C|nr:LacI family DNA-binding transcriptional regulator [Desulfosporosinus sp. PR]MDQ7095342.1 LacI family DNA-binding transcriptional regulator [Desulfosporosinus sp. PR]